MHSVEKDMGGTAERAWSKASFAVSFSGCQSSDACLLTLTGEYSAPFLRLPSSCLLLSGAATSTGLWSSF